MEIKASCVYDLAMVRDMGRNDPILLWLRRMVMLIGVVLSVWSVAMMLRGYRGGSLPYIFAYGIILMGLMVLSGPWMRHRAMGRAKDSLQEFSFCGEGFRVTHSQSDMKGMNESQYSAIVKVVEAPKYLYLYVEKRRAYVVDKNSLSGEDLNELRQFLQSVVGVKYKIRKR